MASIKINGIAEVFKIIIFISIFMLLYISYKISDDLHSAVYIRRKCENQTIEKDMLRYRALQFKKHYSLWILLSIIVTAVVVLFIIILLEHHFKWNINISSSVIYSIASLIAILNIIFNGVPFNRIEKDYNDYTNEIKTIISQVNDMFSRKAGGYIFVKHGLRDTFPEEFLNEIILRWKSDKTTNIGEFNKVEEIIYTDDGIIDEIERTLFIKDERDKIIGAKEGAAEKLVTMLMPMKNHYRKENDEVYQKHELSFIHDAYIDWACKKKSFDDTIEADCNNLKSRLKQLPELTAFDNTRELQGRLFRLLYVSWLSLLLIVYSVYITKKSKQQTIAIIAFILIIFIMFYYIIIFRDRGV